MATITIAQGTLRGGRATTDDGLEYFEFMGIPYAKPPIGNLRFMSPQQPEPWKGIREATSTETIFISCQRDPSNGLTIGSEDCLYLNVYTSNLPAIDTNLKPVIVFIHGGGFIVGNGILKSDNGPDYLLENDVVVVTINYRLGVLGFLCLQIPKAAGNMGLKDQVQALHWVQNNIDKFGGDKNNVTICGVSAGSASCEYLTLSPLAKGLFHKCILESGSSLNTWAINDSEKTKTMAYKLVQELGYDGPDNDMYGFHKVLSQASAQDLTSKAFKITNKESLLRVFFGFVPAVERDLGNGEAFITDTPYRILKEGSFSNVPVLRGFCNMEGSLVIAKKPQAVNELVRNKSFTDYWPHTFENGDVTKFNTELKNAYINNADTSNQFAVQFFGDINIVAGVYLAGKLQSKKTPVYMYKFCYDGKLNVFKALFGLVIEGAAHVDESGYVIRHADLATKQLDESDILMRKRMSKMWTNFAKTGNPTPDYCPEISVQWPQFTEESQQYLNINEAFTIEANYEPEKMVIFDEIMDKYATVMMSCPCYDSSRKKCQTIM